MPTHRQIIRVFAASPGDMAKERDQLAKVVRELNDQFAEPTGVQLELKEWRQVAPGMGRPEDVILDQLPIETWDVFVGLLWLRFGLPPGPNRAGDTHDSGTEEEFRLACRAHQETGRPQVLFYRCTRPAPVNVDAAQLQKVQAFCAGFNPGGPHPGLLQSFAKTGDFARLVRKHLTDLMLAEYQASARPPRLRAADTRVPEGASKSRGDEAQPSSGQSLLTSAPTGRGNGGGGWRNPFIVGVPITDPADFFGRERERDFCLARLRGCNPSPSPASGASGSPRCSTN